MHPMLPILSYCRILVHCFGHLRAPELTFSVLLVTRRCAEHVDGSLHRPHDNGFGLKDHSYSVIRWQDRLPPFASLGGIQGGLKKKATLFIDAPI